VFATLAALSFVVDQRVIFSPGEEALGDPPSLPHPVQVIEMLIAAASK
jgi:cobalamin biosynthesis protein CobD/CbiB